MKYFHKNNSNKFENLKSNYERKKSKKFLEERKVYK